MLKSRTFLDSKVWVKPSTLVRSPPVAMRIARSVVMATVTLGLTRVRNGKPKLGRANGRSRLTHGSQRYIVIDPRVPRQEPVRATHPAPERRVEADPERGAVADAEHAAEWHVERHVVDARRHAGPVDDRGQVAHATEVRRDRVQLEPVDRNARFVGDAHRRIDPVGGVLVVQRQLDVVHRAQVDARPVDGAGGDGGRARWRRGGRRWRRWRGRQRRRRWGRRRRRGRRRRGRRRGRRGIGGRHGERPAGRGRAGRSGRAPDRNGRCRGRRRGRRRVAWRGAGADQDREDDRERRQPPPLHAPNLRPVRPFGLRAAAQSPGGGTPSQFPNSGWSGGGGTSIVSLPRSAIACGVASITVPSL